MRGWWLLLVAGCGRIDLDAVPGDAAPIDVVTKVCAAPIGHDEDGDGVDDACDGCPHLPDGAQVDGDGDGVDDLCDPRPQTATEHIAYFDPFVSRDPSWTTFATNSTLDGESIVDDSSIKLVMRRPRESGNATYVLGGVFGDGTTLRRQLLLGPRTGSTSASYYCELEGIPPDGKLGLTYTPDGNNYTVAVRSNGPPPGNGDFLLAIDDFYPDLACTTTWAVPDQHITATLPAGLATNEVSIAIQEVAVSLHYFLVIGSM